MKLFTDERGNVMLGIGGLMFVIGGVVMYKMVKFEI
jgi:Flp pilus assembly protein TadB